MRPILPIARKGIKEGGRRLREKSIGTGLGRMREARKVPGAGAEGVGYDAALLLEHRESQRPRRAAKRQLVAPNVEVCVLPQLYPLAR
jgi:hypothetical protein